MATLGPVGKRFVKAMEEELVFTSRERQLLIEAARTVEELDRLYAALADEPVVVPDRFGIPHAHPLLVEVRAHRARLAALLGALDVNDEGAKEIPNISEMARAAVKKRWDRAKGIAS